MFVSVRAPAAHSVTLALKPSLIRVTKIERIRRGRRLVAVMSAFLIFGVG